jgi:CDP-diacylglycerol--serine O-phosphatidyltransferase
LFIIVAAIFDMLDGKVARFTKTSSEIGVQLDSLSDFLSFGIAPAVFMFAVGVYNLNSWQIILPVLFILACSWRLARFNVGAELDVKKDFRGLPSPVAGLSVVSFYMFNLELSGRLILMDFYLPLVFILSWLMVSRLPFYSKIALGKKFRGIKAIFVASYIILLLFKTWIFLFPILFSYILFCFAREVYVLVIRNEFKKRRSER